METVSELSVISRTLFAFTSVEAEGLCAYDCVFLKLSSRTSNTMTAFLSLNKQMSSETNDDAAVVFAQGEPAVT